MLERESVCRPLMNLAMSVPERAVSTLRSVDTQSLSSEFILTVRGDPNNQQKSLLYNNVKMSAQNSQRGKLDLKP